MFDETTAKYTLHAPYICMYTWFWPTLQLVCSLCICRWLYFLPFLAYTWMLMRTVHFVFCHFLRTRECLCAPCTLFSAISCVHANACAHRALCTLQVWLQVRLQLTTGMATIITTSTATSISTSMVTSMMFPIKRTIHVRFTSCWIHVRFTTCWSILSGIYLA